MPFLISPQQLPVMLPTDNVTPERMPVRTRNVAAYRALLAVCGRTARRRSPIAAAMELITRRRSRISGHELSFDVVVAEGFDDDGRKSCDGVGAEDLAHVDCDVHNETPVLQLLHYNFTVDLAVCAVAVAHHPPGCNVVFAGSEPAGIMWTVGEDPDAGDAEGDGEQTFDEEEGLPVLNGWIVDASYAVGYPAAECAGKRGC